MKFAYWTFAGFLIFAAVLFAVSNREVIDVRLWPVLDLAMPTYLVVLGAFAIGFLSGGFLFWLRALAAKHKQRSTGRRADRLQRELDALQSQDDTRHASGAAGKSVIPVATPAEPLPKQSGAG
tara:strand:- start:54 stop:422 length:369 start_codon:yes stop_codon:yes gene_type:complete